MAGFKTFANNEVLTAADVNGYLMRQSVIQCANVTARNAIPTPDDGMVVYLVDTDVLQVRRSGAWVQLLTTLNLAPVCSLRKSASQNLGTSAAALTWDVEAHDPFAMHDGTNPTRVTAVRAGLYLVTAYGYNSNTSGLGSIQARLNGATDIPGSLQRRTADAAGALPQVTTFPVVMALNDYLEIMVLHSVATGNIAGGTTLGAATLTVQWVSE